MKILRKETNEEKLGKAIAKLMKGGKRNDLAGDEVPATKKTARTI